LCKDRWKDKGKEKTMQRVYILSYLLLLFLAACDIDKISTPSPTYTASFTSTPTPFTRLEIGSTTHVISKNCAQLSSPSYPDFINSLFPEAGCSYLIQDSSLVVHVELAGQYIDTCPISDRNTPLWDRVLLYIDNRAIPIADGVSYMTGVNLYDESGNFVCMLDDGPYDLFWETVVSPGKHTGRFEITDNHGNVQEFTWNFEILYETK
jgi:hypothetical protein